MDDETFRLTVIGLLTQIAENTSERVRPPRVTHEHSRHQTVVKACVEILKKLGNHPMKPAALMAELAAMDLVDSTSADYHHVATIIWREATAKERPRVQKVPGGYIVSPVDPD